MDALDDSGLGSKKRKCQVKKGFFVLRACGKEAIGKCSISKIPVCKECSRLDEQGNLVSIDEYIKLQKANNKNYYDQHSGGSSYYYDHYSHNDSMWYYMQRDRFYHDSGYSPFNTSDDAGFQNNNQGFGGGDFGGGGAEASFEDDDSSGAGFYDS